MIKASESVTEKTKREKSGVGGQKSTKYFNLRY